MKLEIYGLNEIKDYLKNDRINKSLALGVGKATLELHDVLRDVVARTYATNKDLTTFLAGKSTSTATFGRNIIRGGLEYRDVPMDLSKFPYTFEKGNINAGARRPGLVYTVEIRRGKRKVIFGKGNRGGFVPRFGNVDNPGRAKLFGTHGAAMFERTSASRYPVRLLFGPSVARMAMNAFDYSPSVQMAIAKLENTIIEEFIP